MSRARHHAKKAMGGGVKPEWNAGGTQNAAKEAEERKHGGSVHGEGEHGHHRHDRPKRAAGGAVAARKHGGKAEHHKHEHEHEHERAAGGLVAARARGGAVAGRKRGGGVGADMHPLTTAAKVKHVTKGEQPEEGDPSN